MAAWTGESYMVARERVAEERSLPVVVDVTEIAETLGFRCPASAHPGLLASVPVERAFRRLHHVLLAIDADPDTEILRGAAFRAELAPPITEGEIMPTSFSNLLARARSGLGGTFGRGRAIALHDTVPIMFFVWPLATLRGLPVLAGHPRIVATTLDVFAHELPL